MLSSIRNSNLQPGPAGHRYKVDRFGGLENETRAVRSCCADSTLERIEVKQVEQPPFIIKHVDAVEMPSSVRAACPGQVRDRLEVGQQDPSAFMFQQEFVFQVAWKAVATDQRPVVIMNGHAAFAEQGESAGPDIHLHGDPVIPVGGAFKEAVDPTIREGEADQFVGRVQDDEAASRGPGVSGFEQIRGGVDPVDTCAGPSDQGDAAVSAEYQVIKR